MVSVKKVKEGGIMSKVQGKNTDKKKITKFKLNLNEKNKK